MPEVYAVNVVGWVYCCNFYLGRCTGSFICLRACLAAGLVVVGVGHPAR